MNFHLFPEAKSVWLRREADMKFSTKGVPRYRQLIGGTAKGPLINRAINVLAAVLT
jgi:hypothetical protein